MRMPEAPDFPDFDELSERRLMKVIDVIGVRHVDSMLEGLRAYHAKNSDAEGSQEVLRAAGVAPAKWNALRSLFNTNIELALHLQPEYDEDFDDDYEEDDD